jgi:hypothetical protein
LSKARLLRNGEPLRLVAQTLDDVVGVFAEWPLSGTGSYRLILDSADADEERLVVVQPEKISEEAYGRLINDLQTSLPASIAIGLQSTGALTGLELRPPGETTLAQELARLRRAIHGTTSYGGLAATLRAIARDPHRILIKTQRWLRREHVRRLEPTGLVASIQRPNNIEPASQLPRQLPDVRVEHTVDVYENRLLRSYHDQVTGRLRRLHNAFTAQRTFTAVLEVEELLKLLRRGRGEAEFLDDVSPLTQIPTTVTMVLLKRPEYRSLLQGYLHFRRSAFVELDEPTLEAPLENLPHLYEVWGTLQLIEALLDVAAELGFITRSHALARHFEGVLNNKILRGGARALVINKEANDTTVRLVPQWKFIGSGSGLHSISFTQIPDITVEVQRRGERPALYVFDPKYKLQSEDLDSGANGKPKKIDIDAMHAYRDAIHDFDGVRVVRYAAILYPGPGVQYGKRLEAISARPDEPQSLRMRLRALLEQALGEPAGSRRS